jgi:hypothetical protein
LEAQRRIDRTTRLRLAPAATRLLGSDLLVNVGGATAPVQRLLGTGPELWECFARGFTVGEAAAHLAPREGAPADIEANVVAFGTSLVRARLAEPVW